MSEGRFEDDKHPAGPRPIDDPAPGPLAQRWAEVMETIDGVRVDLTRDEAGELLMAGAERLRRLLVQHESEGHIKNDDTGGRAVELLPVQLLGCRRQMELLRFAAEHLPSGRFRLSLPELTGLLHAGAVQVSGPAQSPVAMRPGLQ